MIFVKKIMMAIGILVCIFMLSMEGDSKAEAASDSYKTVYYRQVVYNHVSPFVPIRGLYEISEATAQKSPHYIFRYNAEGRLAEIINNNPEKWKSHPLTHIKVHRIAFNYIDNQEIRTFYDINGQRVTNIRGVYKEIHKYDASGFKVSADFYDLNNQPMNSNWNISRYSWGKKDNLVIERRFDRDGNRKAMSPYFKFYIVGILFDDKGFSRATYNLNENLEITNSDAGIASYQDTYDSAGNHIAYTYYNQDNELTPAPYQISYAIGKKYYDDKGNVTKEEYINENYKLIWTVNFAYDENGSFVKKFK